MGKLIVFEGIDGSGKSTQFDLLTDRLAKERRDFRRIRFPQYDEPSSALVKMYLGGEFGDDPDAVNAYAASSFFAVDRYASFMKDWRGYYENGGLILTDRYTTSNAIHQGAKLPAEKRESFFRWLYEYEFDFISLPSPDIVVFMDLDAATATERLKRRQLETGTSADIHERDVSYLEQCVISAAHAADYYQWIKIPCLSGSRERAIEDIHIEIYKLITNVIWGGHHV